MKHFKDTIIDKQTGEEICNCGCGYVLEENLSDLSIKDSISNDTAKRLLETHHKTNNDTHHDGGLGTDIEKIEFTTTNRPVKLTQFSKLQKYSRTTTSKDQRLIRYITEIKKILDHNNFSQSLLVHCIYYLKKCEKKFLLANKKTIAVSICIVYLTTKQIPGFNYRVKNDMKKYHIKYTTILQYTSELKPVFTLDNKRSINDIKLLSLEKLCDKVHLSKKIRLKARSILEYCNAKSLFPTINSQVWVATCVWLAIRNDDKYSNFVHLQIDDLANHADVSVVSMNHLKRKLLTNGTLHLLSLAKGIMKNIANYVHEENN